VVPSTEDSGVRAMKIFKSQFNSNFEDSAKKSDLDTIINEINTLKMLKHENIVRLYEIIEHKEKG
jgi:serine/threonine protein kinase